MTALQGDLPDRARAAVITAPETVEVAEFPVAPPPPGWALMRVRRSGICGTDLKTFRGQVLQYAGTPHERNLSYPIICGHENVGEIVALGGEVRDWSGVPLAPGQRVVPGANVSCGVCMACRRGFPYYACEALDDYGNSLNAAEPPYLFGGWSELMYLKPGSRIFPVPDRMSDAMAALVELYSVTHGLDKVADDVRGGVVYVLGCGPLGLCHISKAIDLGAAEVVAVDLVESRLEAAVSLGATAMRAERGDDPGERHRMLRDRTGGLGADVAVDAAGNAAAFLDGMRSLRFGGTLLEAGAFTGSNPATIDITGDLCLSDRRLVGVGGEDDAAYPPSIAALSDPEHRLHGVVSGVVGLAGITVAINRLEAGAALKVQVDPYLTGGSE